MGYTLKVSGIKVETPDAATICFKQPTLRKLKYLPGQYITVIVTVNNRKYKRPYSLSSSPDIDSTLNITVKRLAHGVVSNHLIDVVKEGDLIEVIEPMGGFVFNTEIHNGKEVFLWGAGSGITPLFSILKAALKSGIQKITLAYCNKNIGQIIFYTDLLQLNSQYSDRFSLNLFCTNEDSPNVRKGRINESDISMLLENAISAENTIHYICGPAGLKEVVKKALIERGLTKEQIFSEDFEHIVNEDALKDVRTRFVEFIRGDEKITVEVVRGKSILEAGLDDQIDLPYSCQTGSCTLCKAKLIGGEVKEIGIGELDSQIDENERLLCCCYPLTDNVKFEII